MGTAAYGHFGRTHDKSFTWENLEFIDALKDCANNAICFASCPLYSILGIPLILYADSLSIFFG